MSGMRLIRLQCRSRSPNGNLLVLALREGNDILMRAIAALFVDRQRGALDFRRTVRKSLGTGGVPIDPVFRKPNPAKPELYVLADISGSVATFAAFTLQLTFALRSQFSRVRSFVFVDGVDEVTDVLQAGTGPHRSHPADQRGGQRRVAGRPFGLRACVRVVLAAMG